MKKTKIIFAVAAIAAVLAMSAAFAACGGEVALPEGEYSGQYKVAHTATVEESNFFTGETVEKTVNYWGVKVGFTVDDENTIWNIPYRPRTATTSAGTRAITPIWARASTRPNSPVPSAVISRSTI